MSGQVIEAAERFTRKGRPCRFCPSPATVIHFPHVDHRRRKPWPEPIWTCVEHDRRGVVQATHISHPRASS